MGLVIAAMAPHGFSLIPDMNDDAEVGMKTRNALFEMGRRFQDAAPDVIVIATPHGFRVDGTICVSNAGRGAGTLKWAGRQVEQNIPFDTSFAERLTAEAKTRGVPVSNGSYGGGGASGFPRRDRGARSRGTGPGRRAPRRRCRRTWPLRRAGLGDPGSEA